jgi:hypothetical protein
MCIVQCTLFWLVEEIAELAVGPTGCGKMARGGFSFAWNYEYSVARSAVLTEAEERIRAVLAKCGGAFPNCL